MNLSPFGQIVSDTWAWFKSQYPTIQLDEFCIMPNHLHGILFIGDPTGRGGSRTAPTGKSLGSLIGAFKTVSTKQVNLLRNMPGVPLWQRNFYEHIIRDETDFTNARAYILANPLEWIKDPENHR